MFKKISLAIVFTMLSGTLLAAPKPEVYPVEIVAPATIPVYVINEVEAIAPMFYPKETIQTMISADGKPGIISEEQVIRKVIVLPSPGKSAALACRLHLSIDGVAISYASWNGNDYGSFSLSIAGPIDVKPGMELITQLTSLGGEGVCSADLVMLGTRIAAM